MPSSCAGPENTAPWPRTICVSVIPGVCAAARAANPSAMTAAIPVRNMVSPIAGDRYGSHITPLAAGRQGGTGGLALRLSAGEELAHLLHEALGARVVAARVLVVELVELAQQLAVPLGEAHRRLHDHAAE